MSDRKKTKAEKPFCVFYKDVPCLVRKEMRKSRGTLMLEQYLEPLEKGTDEVQIVRKYADAMKELLDRFIGEWNTLPNFCRICPIRLKKGKGQV